MFDDGELPRDLAVLVVPLAGAMVETGDRWEPLRLVDPAGEPVRAVVEFFVDLQARGRSQATVRSYGMDLLRWFRFCWAAGTPWDRATRAEARDFCRWMLLAGKPARPHWRAPEQAQVAASSGVAYAPSVRAHCETVLRSFYDYHLQAGSGPVINPFPLDRSRRGGRVNAHHNPMEPFRKERAGLYRPRVPSRVPRSVPDDEFNEIFARLPSHRDRALVAFYVSTGARARMFERAGQAAGSGATLHALRHTAAYRMAEDPQLPISVGVRRTCRGVERPDEHPAGHGQRARRAFTPATFKTEKRG